MTEAQFGVSSRLLRLHDIFGAKRQKAPPPPEFAKVVPVQTADVPKVKAWNPDGTGLRCSAFRVHSGLFRYIFQSRLFKYECASGTGKGLLEAKLKPYSILCCCGSITLLFNFLMIRHDQVCILPTLQYDTLPYFISYHRIFNHIIDINMSHDVT